jgi:hypothetical protein
MRQCGDDEARVGECRRRVPMGDRRAFPCEMTIKGRWSPSILPFGGPNGKMPPKFCRAAMAMLGYQTMIYSSFIN